MIWQRVCLAIGVAVGGPVLSQGALAQTSDPANDAGAVAAPTGEPAPTAQRTTVSGLTMVTASRMRGQRR
jgi:hypothetical protein